MVTIYIGSPWGKASLYMYMMAIRNIWHVIQWAPPEVNVYASSKFSTDYSTCQNSAVYMYVFIPL